MLMAQIPAMSPPQEFVEGGRSVRMKHVPAVVYLPARVRPLLRCLYSPSRHLRVCVLQRALILLW